MPEIPYQDDQVIEILIDGAPDWIPIVQGSMRAVEVGLSPDQTLPGIVAKDRMDGTEIFCYALKLVAVKFQVGDSVSTPTADGRLLP